MKHGSRTGFPGGSRCFYGNKRRIGSFGPHKGQVFTRISKMVIPCAILAQIYIINDPDDAVLFILSALYYLTIILGRVFSIISRRNTRSTICNGIFILCTIACFIFGDELILPLFVIIHMLIHITLISFSRIRFEVIRKIIRKTYAAEILSGMVLLILAFSMVFPQIETQIKTFGDALWYCFTLVTTIGFGDMTATHPIGRILSVILGLYGIVIVALITSIIVNFYNETKHDHNDPDENDPGKKDALTEDAREDDPEEGSDAEGDG